MPPNGTALAQRLFGDVRRLVRGGLRREFSARLGVLYCTPRLHEVTHQAGLPLWVEIRVGHAPQPATHYKIAAVRRDRMLQSASMPAVNRGMSCFWLG
jgi:hypothetical protein